jgi:hypothetical protein
MAIGLFAVGRHLGLDPLHGTCPDSKTGRDLHHSRVPLAQGVADCIFDRGGDPTVTPLLAIPFRLRPAVSKTVPNYGAFEFGKNARHFEYRLAAWRGGVDPLFVKVQVDL